MKNSLIELIKDWTQYRELEKLEDSSIGSIQTENVMERGGLQSIQNLWNNIKQTNMPIQIVQIEERRQRKYFKRYWM